jgi:hypothetical protein
MQMLSALSFLLVSCSLKLAFALPSSEIQAQQLFRRDNLQAVFDVGKASPCAKLDLDDVQSLPGWSKLQQYAMDTWGEGDVTITVNPPGYKDKPATICVLDPVNVTMTGQSNCTKDRVAIEPAKGAHTIDVDVGYMNVGNWNITNATSAAHAAFFLANFEMPNITAQRLGAMMGKGAFINAPTEGFATMASNKTVSKASLMAANGKTCIGTVLNEHCQIPAKGQIQLTASGYIWFTYKTARAPVDKPKGGKHKRYTVKIEDVLKNVTERSVSIDFAGSMNTTMRSDYFDECRWNFALY